eukprot:4492126-Pleurochrysis_carterae.AAC.1
MAQAGALAACGGGRCVCTAAWWRAETGQMVGWRSCGDCCRGCCVRPYDEAWGEAIGDACVEGLCEVSGE